MKFVLSGIAKYYLIYDELMFKCQKTLDTFSRSIHRCYKEKKEKKKKAITRKELKISEGYLMKIACINVPI